jgi:hypothetical protein
MNAQPGTLLTEPTHVRLAGSRLRWKRFRRWTDATTPACVICRQAFTEGGEPGLTSGYSVVGGGPAGQDDYVWLCAICFEGLRDDLGWVVLDTRDRPIEPAGLWEAAFGFDAEKTPTP